MTKFLQDLRFYDTETAALLAMLERLSGNKSIDIRLSSDLQRRGLTALKELGLDPSDSEPIEIYHMLAAKLADDESRFLKEIGALSSDSADEVINKLCIHLNKIFTGKTVLTPKSTVIKNLIKKSPPKNALKLLRYRSLDSALRRCPLAVLIAACELTEPHKWRKQFAEKLDRLESNDFELKQVEFLNVESDRWGKLHDLLVGRSGHSVFRANLAGGIVLVPPPRSLVNGQLSLIYIAAVSALSKLRVHASFTPRVLFDTSVPTTYSQHVYDRDEGSLVIRTVHFSWIDVHHQMALNENLRTLFEPHLNKHTVSDDDFAGLLRKSSASYEWWADKTALAYRRAGETVSANIYDCSRNLAFRRPYGGHTCVAFSRELDSLIRSNYLASQELSNKIYEQLQAASDFNESEAVISDEMFFSDEDFRA